MKKINFEISENYKTIEVEGYTFNFQELDVRDATLYNLTSVPSDEDAAVFLDKETATEILNYLELKL